VSVLNNPPAEAAELRARGIVLDTAVTVAGSDGPREKQRQRNGPGTNCFKFSQGIEIKTTSTRNECLNVSKDYDKVRETT